MNKFMHQVKEIQQRQQDRIDASAEASIQFKEDYLEIYDTCKSHEDYWQQRAAKPCGYGDDWAFPDHPQHYAWCAKQKHLRMIQDFKERHQRAYV